MLFKKPSHKTFEYKPRFYNPNKDDEIRRERRLKFSRYRKAKKKNGNLITYLILLIVILYIFLKLQGFV